MKPTLTSWLIGHALTGILLGILAVVILLACWIAVKIWGEEEKIRRERRKEFHTKADIERMNALFHRRTRKGKS